MADMHQIKATVGQGDAIAGVAPIRHPLPKFFARNNFSMRQRQSIQGSQFSASDADVPGIDIPALPTRQSLARLMLAGSRRRFRQSIQQFLLADGCGAAFHHDDATGVIRQLSSLFRSGARG
jgi:hypothetical protein